MSRRVLVIGAGVSGLTSAHCLLAAGFDVTVLADKPADQTASVVAGALWEWPPAVCGHHNDAESLRKSKQWSADSYDQFNRLSAQPETGVTMAPAVFYFRNPVASSPEELQKMEEAQRHVRGFEHSANLIERYGISRNFGLQDAYTYIAPLIDTNVYTTWLRQQVVLLGGQFVERKLGEPLSQLEPSLLREFEACAIVNCSGLGSIDLAQDEMQPLRGALIRVKNDGISMPRITVAHCLAHEDEAALQQMIYIIPRGPDRLLLGGIAELGQWDTTIGLENYPPIRDILQRCQEFMPVLKSAVIDEQEPTRIGLRPYRQKNVRLERDGTSRIVHNYGHGGSGYTFSWGCGHDVLAAVQSFC